MKSAKYSKMTGLMYTAVGAIEGELVGAELKGDEVGEIVGFTVGSELVGEIVGDTDGATV